MRLSGLFACKNLGFGKRQVAIFGFIPEMDGFGGHAAAFVAHICIMTPCGIDVAVSEDIGNQIDVTAFLVLGRSERTAQLVRGDFFQRYGNPCVFFDDIFDGTH